MGGGIGYGGKYVAIGDECFVFLTGDDGEAGLFSVNKRIKGESFG